MRDTRGAVAVLLCLLLAGLPSLAAELEKPALPSSISPLPQVPSLPAASIPASLTGAELPSAGIPAPAPQLPASLAQARPTPAPQISAKPERPSLLSRLRAAIPLLAPANAGSEEQKAAAEDAFNVKAGGDAAAPLAAAKTPAPKRAPAARGRKRAPEPEPEPQTGDDGGGPDYPRETVTFRGKTYPAQVFRPNIPVEPLLIQAIDSAQKTLHIALYEFKLTGVLDALRRARERGVEIKIVLDFSQVYPQKDADSDYDPKRSREIWALIREGFDVKVLRGLGQFGINHNKFVVVDYGAEESLGEYGSYNWSWAAEKSHYENANFTTDQGDIDGLMAYWRYLDGLAQPLDKDDKPENYSWPKTVPPPPVVAPSLDFNGVKFPPNVFAPTTIPGQATEDWIVKAIENSRESIDLSIFALRSTRIAEALVAAHNRKPAVKIRVIIDESQSQSGPFGVYTDYLAASGIETYTLSGPDPDSDFPMAQKNHNKLAVFDGKMVETGSANYTKYAAEANFENAHFKTAPKAVAAYRFFFDHMLSRAKRFPAPAKTPVLPTDAELAAEIQHDPAPRPEPVPVPPPAPGIKARDIVFNGKTFPSYAFRPDIPVEPLLVSAIDAASKSVRLALYEFNLDDVMQALRRAKARGVKIEIVIDRAHVYTTGRDHTGNIRMPSEQIQALFNEGFDVLILKGKKSGIQHNKYLLADAEDAAQGGGIAFFGSYNFARTAEHNHFEAVKIENNGKRLRNFLAYFDYKRGLAKPLDREKFEQVLSRTAADAAAEDAVQHFVDEGFDIQALAGETPGESAGIDSLTSRESQQLLQHLDGDVDLSEGHNALDAALQRAADEAAEETAQERDLAAKAKRGEVVPPPPMDLETPIDMNGEKFQLEYFSPQGGIENAWTRAIGAARDSIEIAMFSFWSKPIADALVAAAKARPDLKIRLVLDAGQSKLAKIEGVPVIDWMEQHGFEVKMLAGPNERGDPMLEKQHSKFMLIDGKWLLMGSFNLSPNAENNSFENENVIDDPTDVAGFVDFFARMFARGWARKARQPDPKTPQPPQPAEPAGV